MFRKKKIERLEKEITSLQIQLNRLISALKEEKLIEAPPSYAFGGSQVIFPTRNLYNKQIRLEDQESKMKLLEEYLGIEFEWTDCEPHFEIKKKEEK